MLLKVMVGAALFSTVLADDVTEDCKMIDASGKWCTDCNAGWLLLRNRDDATGELLDIGVCQRLVGGKCTIGDCESGFGRVVYNSGDVYEGYFKPEPAGKDAVVKGESFRIHHGHGKYRSASGDVYDGEYKDGKRHGHGKYTWADGTVYDGEYKDNKMHGHGTYTWADGTVYDGEYKDDKRHGHGKGTSADGSVYDGEWKDDKHHGHGKKTWPDGSVYEGEYKDDKFHGHGKFSQGPDGIVLYNGEWRNGKPIGESRPEL